MGVKENRAGAAKKVGMTEKLRCFADAARELGVAKTECSHLPAP